MIEIILDSFIISRYRLSNYLLEFEIVRYNN
jgi:hypothetical protein